MGVPTFYKWLCTKYPKVVKDVVEERQVLDEVTREWTPVDLKSANPNGIEFDNLYIDMNGVVHPCCHPEDGPQPDTESEMFQNLCDYIDRIVCIVRPRKLIYLALDGVAPRAKTNQQRSRRFKAAAEAQAAEDAYEELKLEWSKEGREAPPKLSRWDSNAITPGTRFMHRLAEVLRYYVARRMESSSYWSGISVIVSDSNVPGEGEHKIMAFVKQQRQNGDSCQNTKHVIHGMDADLIMLGLATHEPHFYVIREIVTENRGAPATCPRCGGSAHQNPQDCSLYDRSRPPAAQLENAADGGIIINPDFRSSWKPMQFLQLPVLREYLQAEFNFSAESLLHQDVNTGKLKRVPSDLERHIDDFVLMCFFVGNDFLPHLPSLSIHKGSIDQMIALYQAIYPQLGDYLTCEGVLNIEALSKFTSYLAQVEPRVFEEEARRKEIQARNRRNSEEQRKRRSLDTRNTNPGDDIGVSKRQKLDPDQAHSHIQEGGADSPATSSEGGFAHSNNIQPHMYMAPSTDTVDRFKKALKESLEKRNVIDDPVDNVKLGVGDPTEYRLAYYREKFHLEPTEDIEKIAAKAGRHYIRGMQWLLLYYFQSCPSQEWYYPFHYAPLAMDIYRYGLVDRDEREKIEAGRRTDLSFTPGTPLTPLQQLLATLPPRSAQLLPQLYAIFMTDPSSPIRDFYPKYFYEDPDGKRYRWQWVAQLPFVDTSRLRLASALHDVNLDAEAVARNALSSDLLFLSKSHPLSAQIAAESGPSMKLDGVRTLIRGEVSEFAVSDVTRKMLVDCDGFEPFTPSCLIFTFTHPKLTKPHKSSLRPGAAPPPPLLTLTDKNPDLANQNSRGRGPFNSTAAKRMILQLVGGPALTKFLEQEQRAWDARRVNAPHIPYAPASRNVDATSHGDRSSSTHSGSFPRNRSCRDGEDYRTRPAAYHANCGSFARRGSTSRRDTSDQMRRDAPPPAPPPWDGPYGNGGSQQQHDDRRGRHYKKHSGL